ncbi:MAG TPA: CehA/McbA family metallohydrolase [Phototrophicaceae bacterium]|jgi:hypothetical protein|nr:CehA/McbA family metallohydrolase [Phototrophicaceae bacterium]
MTMIQIRMTGTLDYRQTKQHIPHAFTVPDGATVLKIWFDYSPKWSRGQEQRNDLSLTLFDPEGARGARHNNQDRNLRITAQSATPGYTPGTLQPGTWVIWIDSHRILPPDRVEYRFEIEISTELLSADEPVMYWQPGQVAPRGAGWYRGDLHGHTWHSDGKWDIPDFVRYARKYELDFVTLTDHNTVSGLAQIDSLATDDLLTMGGIELTTYYGHALALGTRQWLEWRIQPGITMPMIAEQVKKAGALFIIAHPHSIGDPYCTGCDWNYNDMLPGNARCVEIWNGDWGGDSGNEDTVQLWYRWLNQGYRMVATAGTDIHSIMDVDNLHPGFNVVYAAELSQSAILQAIRVGHLYLSGGPRLELTAQNEAGQTAMMGDTLDGETLTINVNWKDCQPGDTLRLIVNGQVRETLPLNNGGEQQWTIAASECHWCVVEIRAPDGIMRAITNPIFAGTAADWN